MKVPSSQDEKKNYFTPITVMPSNISLKIVTIVCITMLTGILCNEISLSVPQSLIMSIIKPARSVLEIGFNNPSAMASKAHSVYSDYLQWSQEACLCISHLVDRLTKDVANMEERQLCDVLVFLCWLNDSNFVRLRDSQRAASNIVAIFDKAEGMLRRLRGMRETKRVSTSGGYLTYN